MYCGLAAPADHRVKRKRCEKKDKYPDLTRVLKKPWDIKVKYISIEIGAICTVTEGLITGREELEIRWWVDSIQSTAFLRSTEY